jgi:S1-C subfamily serine protease
MKEAKEQRIRALKDHLRSLSDRKPPPQAAPTSESESVTPEIPSSFTASGSVVTITADGRTGKGFIVDGDGMIATNFHLVNAANRIKVSTPSGDVFLGKTVRLDEGRDLALIQIPTKTPQYFTLGDASSVDVGENVFVLGPPSGGSRELTKTIINALRVIEGTLLIQVDQQIDPGNSGSPFVTEQGTVVGIASYRMGPEDSTAGFGVGVQELKAFISGQ